MPVSEDLKKLYADAFEKGIFIKEFPVPDGIVAFAGRIQKLEQAGFDKEKRKNMDFMQASLYMTPGDFSETREEAVKEALEAYFHSDERIPSL